MDSIRSARFRVVILSLLLLSAQPLARQGKPAHSTGLTELVDFAVVSDDGRPVTDVTASEVTFKVDGRMRSVNALQFVELAPTASVDRGTRLAPPLPAPYGSNRLEDSGRLVMIALDRESIRPGRERPAREAALRFLSRLSPHDRVGLVSLPRVEVEPTRDHDQVQQALQQMTGLAAQERSASDAACRGRQLLNTLSGLLKTLALVEGPKTIALISTGLMPPMRDAPMTGAPGQCEVRSVDFDEVGTAASAARAHLYVIQPNDDAIDSASSAIADQSASRFRSADDYLSGLQHLAGVAAGDIYRLGSADPEKVFARVASESSAYYVIAFEPDQGERNGLPHRIEIKVARERVTVRTQPQFTIAKSEVKSSDITPQKMLREARQYHDLPLRATAYSSLGADDSRLKVIAAAEPVDGSVALSSAAVGLYDAKGKLAAQWTAEKDELAARPLVAALAGAAGPYRLRVAAIDAAGRRGTVDYAFRADLEAAGSLRLSAIALGVLKPGFQPRLQFVDEPAAVGYLEIYGAPPRGAELTVRMEVAESAEAMPLVASVARIQGTEDDSRRMAIAALALASLAPGDYVVRAIVSLDGRAVGRASRTLRKVKA